jgi:hypothetical protein
VAPVRDLANLPIWSGWRLVYFDHSARGNSGLDARRGSWLSVAHFLIVGGYLSGRRDGDGALGRSYRGQHGPVADVQSTGKCRHRQERNKKKGKHSILHGIPRVGRSPSRCSAEYALGIPQVCIELTSAVLGPPLKLTVFSNTVGIRYVDRVNVFLDQLKFLICGNDIQQ